MSRLPLSSWLYSVVSFVLWFDIFKFSSQAFVPRSRTRRSYRVWLHTPSVWIRTSFDKESTPLHLGGGEFSQEDQEEEALQSLQDFHRGSWKGCATSFSVTADVAAGIVKRHKSPEYEVSVRLDRRPQDSLSITETLKWEDKVVSRKSPLFNMDVDSVDASYSVDVTLPSLPSDIIGTDKLIQFGIEHCLATSNDERMRCFALYGVDQSLARIVFCEESRVKATTLTERPRNGESTASSSDSILNKVVGGATSSFGSSSPSSDDASLALSRYPMSLMDMTSNVWLGDTIVRDLPHVSLSSTVGQGFGSFAPSKSVSSPSFANWDLGVQKAAFRVDWDYDESVSVLHDFGRGMGAETSPTFPRALTGTLCVNESFSRRIPKEERIVYIDYDNGDHCGFLLGSMYVQVPRFLSFSSTPKPTKPFYTDFSVFQTNAVATEDVDKEICCSRITRLYNFEGQLKQGSTSFLTLKDNKEPLP